jgi:hypothetical protein
MAEHTESIMSKDGELAGRAILASHREDAHHALRILSAYKALTGATFKRQTAQLFVVNDSGNKQVYVLEMEDILNLICKAIRK